MPPRLIPPTISVDTPSEGERVVFDALALAKGADDWVVLHSLDLANHRRRLAGEIDFLVIVPGKGVLVLEVKGCPRLRRHDGLWYYGSDPRPDERGPFKQASEAMHSLRQRLVHRHRDLAGVVFWSAVCFPFVDFAEASEEWHPWQVIDRRALAARPLAQLCEGVLDHARTELVEPRRALVPRRASRAPRAAGRRAAARPARRLRVLREPQVAGAAPGRGGAPLHRGAVRGARHHRRQPARRVRRSGRHRQDAACRRGRPPRRGRRPARAAAVLQPAAGPLAAGRDPGPAPRAGAGASGKGPGVVTRTLHEHLRLLAGVTPTPEQVCRQSFWQDELPELAAEALLERTERAARDGGRSREIYDEIVVDEAQDVLRRSYLDVLDLSLAGGLGGGIYRLFGDFTYQRIYDAAALSLDQCWRPAAPAPAPCATSCASTAATRRGWRSSPAPAAASCPATAACAAPTTRPSPRSATGATTRGQGKLLAAVLDELSEQGFKGPRTAVLSPHGDEHCCAHGLTEQPWKDRLAPLLKEARAVATRRRRRAWPRAAGRMGRVGRRRAGRRRRLARRLRALRSRRGRPALQQDALLLDLPLQGPRVAGRRAHRHRGARLAGRLLAALRGLHPGPASPRDPRPRIPEGEAGARLLGQGR